MPTAPIGNSTLTQRGNPIGKLKECEGVRGQQGEGMTPLPPFKSSPVFIHGNSVLEWYMVNLQNLCGQRNLPIPFQPSRARAHTWKPWFSEPEVHLPGHHTQVTEQWKSVKSFLILEGPLTKISWPMPLQDTTFTFNFKAVNACKHSNVNLLFICSLGLLSKC